jgi:hypothetical protein
MDPPVPRSTTSQRPRGKLPLRLSDQSLLRVRLSVLPYAASFADESCCNRSAMLSPLRAVAAPDEDGDLRPLLHHRIPEPRA